MQKSAEAERSRKAWEKCHGKKVPAGMIVHHKDGNPRNIKCSNLEAITRGKSNTIHKKGKTWASWDDGMQNKPNKPEKQRRYR